MNKKPEIFKPNMNFIDNNKKAYYSYIDKPLEIIEDKDEHEEQDVIEFLNRLSNSNSYIFNKTVVIITEDKTYETRIAGKIGNKLITLDNNSINIDTIKKIYEKK